ncbi:MAG: Tex-like N-terminal domain-containing protein, partial [Planctomycetota bacterium]
MDQPSEPGAHPVEGQAPTRAGQPGHDYSRIAQDLQIRRVQVDAVARLLDEGYTVPFIVRFRKDRTQGLDDAAVRQIARRLSTIRAFQERKKNLLANLSQQGRLVPELESAIAEAETPKRLDDLTLPFR